MMDPKGFVELEMEPLREEASSNGETGSPADSSGTEDEAGNYSRKEEGLEGQLLQEPMASEEAPSPSSGSQLPPPRPPPADGGPYPRAKSRKDTGLRGKRGGKALKIHVYTQQEEAERKRVQYAAAMAGNAHAPLYPLDLQGHVVDSSQDEESDRSSSLSPEVAANGFGSPIELPSRDSFDELNRRHDEKERFVGGGGDGEEERLSPLDEIPLSTKFQSVQQQQQQQREDEFDEEFLLEGGPTGGGGGGGEGLSRKSFAIYVLKTTILIILWYILSTMLTMYNKILVGKEDRHFPAPLLMNTIHFSMQAVISTLLLRCMPAMRPSVRISWKDYFMRVVPTGAATALDIDLTNLSLVFVTVTFETMCKSGAPVFLLIFAFLFKLEVPSYKLLGIILTISAGVMLTVTKAPDFNIPGFILVMSASVVAGFRWTVTQLLLQKEEYGLNNPFAVMSYTTPVMASISLVLSLIVEPWKELGESKYFDSSLHVLSSFAIMLLGGTIAFFMVSTEYILISETSAVTLTVAGVMKEVVTILFAVLFLKDQVTPLKGLGLVVIILGVSLYNIYKYQKLKEREAGGDHVSNNLNGNHKYVALKESKAVFELGDEIDEDMP